MGRHPTAALCKRAAPRDQTSAGADAEAARKLPLQKTRVTEMFECVKTVENFLYIITLLCSHL